MTNISIKPISMQWVTAQLLLSMTCVCFCYSILTSRGGASRLLAVRRAETEQKSPSNWVKGFTWRGLHQWRRDRRVVQTLCTYECVCTEGLEWLDYQLLDQPYSLKYIQNIACCFYFFSAPQDRLTTEKCLTVGRISPIITSNTNRTPRLFLPGEYESMHTFYFRQWNYKDRLLFSPLPPHLRKKKKAVLVYVSPQGQL